MVLAVLAPPTLLGTPVFLWEMLLDLVGLGAAIWSVWMLAWLDLEGALRGAFRYITIGGAIFALLHLQDSLLRLAQALDGSLINLIHIGSMLLVMVFLVLGLGRLADASTQWKTTADGLPPVRWWPTTIGLALTLGAFSFIVYGVSPAAVAWAGWGLQTSLIVLTITCAVQVFRARLGGTVGRALGLALLGVLVFSLVHPLQAALFAVQLLGPSPFTSLFHRIFVIPAFVLFTVGMSALSRAWVPHWRASSGARAPVKNQKGDDRRAGRMVYSGYLMDTVRRKTMRPDFWQPPIARSPAEQAILGRVRRAKRFVFLRDQRHLRFSEAVQAELAVCYPDPSTGRPPTPPAQLALATLLQAYTGVCDDEVIEATLMDRRWQVVLDCLDCQEAPFSKGTLVAFRQRLITNGLDRRLVERTIELAHERGGFGARPLRAALASLPRWGAGRGEATYNLLGHAARQGTARDRRPAGAGAGGPGA